MSNLDGVTPIDLIDGDTLCDLLKRYRLGVRVTERIVEDSLSMAVFGMTSNSSRCMRVCGGR